MADSWNISECLPFVKEIEKHTGTLTFLKRSVPGMFLLFRAQLVLLPAVFDYFSSRFLVPDG